jgi:hypothetical protein
MMGDRLSPHPNSSEHFLFWHRSFFLASFRLGNEAFLLEMPMKLLRFAAVAATLIVTGTVLAADSPAGKAYADRYIDPDKTDEAVQASSPTATTRKADSGRHAVVNDNGPGILERHLLWLAGIAY